MTGVRQCGAGPQPDDVRRQGHGPVVFVAGAVVDGDLSAHGADDVRARAPPPVVPRGRRSGTRGPRPRDPRCTLPGPADRRLRLRLAPDRPSHGPATFDQRTAAWLAHRAFGSTWHPTERGARAGRRLAALFEGLGAGSPRSRRTGPGPVGKQASGGSVRRMGGAARVTRARRRSSRRCPRRWSACPGSSRSSHRPPGGRARPRSPPPSCLPPARPRPPRGSRG